MAGSGVNNSLANARRNADPVNAVAGLTPLFYLAERLYSSLDDNMLLCGARPAQWRFGHYHAVKSYIVD